MYDAGQATFAHYATATEEPLPQDPAGFFKQGGLAAVQNAEAGAGPLRVLIEQRRGVVRNFLQLEQLLSACNGAAGGQPRYACRLYVFSDDYRRCPLLTHAESPPDARHVLQVAEHGNLHD